MGYQTRDVLEAMRGDSGIDPATLRVDGGASVMDVLLQFQSDLLGIQVQRPVVSETTALGAAYLAGLATGYWESLEEIERIWKAEKTFEPAADRTGVEAKYAGWKRAVERARDWEEH